MDENAVHGWMMKRSRCLKLVCVVICVVLLYSNIQYRGQTVQEKVKDM